MPIDTGASDMSSWVASGHDFASGNILLSGWYGGAQTEYFPQRFVNGITALLFNDWHQSFVWAEFIILCMALFGMYIISSRLVEDKFNPLIFIGVTAIFIGGVQIPNLAWTNHLGSIGLMLIPAYLLYIPRLKKTGIIIVIGFIALITNNYVFIYFVIPYIIERAIHIYRTKKIDRRLIWVFTGLILYMLAGALFAHSRITPSIKYKPKFIQNDSLFPKLQDLTFSVFDGFNGSIWGNSPFTCHSIYFLLVIIMIFMTLLIIRNKFSKNWIAEDQSDSLTSFLVISSVFVIAASIFANNYFSHEKNIIPPRYLIGFYVNSSILLITQLHALIKKQSAAQVFMAAALVLSIWSNHGLFKEASSNILYRDMANIIKYHKLEQCGYAPSYIANNINIYLNRQQLVHFESYLNNPEAVKYCPANFILQFADRTYSTGSDSFLYSMQQVLPEPTQIVNTRYFLLSIYDYDISQEIPMNEAISRSNPKPE